METQNISVPEKLGGFPIEDATAALFKKFFWRNNTGSQTALYNETNSVPFVWQEQICTDAIPDVPPNDFVPIDNSTIATLFNIQEDEIPAFYTYINGLNVFQIQQSVSVPYLFYIKNAKLQPFQGNVDESFSGTSVTSNKNILSISIPFNFKNSAYAGQILRTAADGELSVGGHDVVQPTQLPYIFDNGWLNLYAPDTHTLSENRIGRNNPPAVTCYVYTGGVGNLHTGGGGGGSGNISSITAGYGINVSPTSASNVVITNTLPTQWSTITGQGIAYAAGTVMMGKYNTNLSNGYTVDVSGVLYSDSIVAQSYETFSDKRLKCNISTINTNSNVLNLGTFAFNYIHNSSITEIGLIAQEVESIAPEIVREQSGYKTIQYDRLPVLLLPVIKQQQQQIELLQNELRLIKQAVGLR